MNKWRNISIVLILIIVVYLLHDNSQKKETTTPTLTENIKKVPVVAVNSEKATFLDKIQIQGNVICKEFVQVSPEVGGIITAFYVNEGDIVVKNKTNLFQIDSLKYQKMLDIKKQDLELAKCNLNVNMANLDKIKADFKKIEIDFYRSKRLFENKAITKDQIELQESRYTQGQAVLKNAESLVVFAEEQKKQAFAAYEIAERDLNNTLVKASMDGVVSERIKEPGEMVKIGETVLKINNINNIEISAYIPGEHYFKVIPGETEIIINHDNKNIDNASLQFKSPVVNEKLRNFEIKVSLNKNEHLIPGMLIDLDVIFSKKINIGVPFSAVMQKKNGKAVYIAKNGISILKYITIGLRTNGLIEITNNSIEENELIIIEGQFILKDGLPLDIKKGTN